MGGLEMPRARRFDLVGLAQHVTQRGNDRQPCFFREMDYVRYLRDLRGAAIKRVGWISPAAQPILRRCLGAGNEKTPEARGLILVPKVGLEPTRF